MTPSSWLMFSSKEKGGVRLCTSALIRVVYLSRVKTSWINLTAESLWHLSSVVNCSCDISMGCVTSHCMMSKQRSITVSDLCLHGVDWLARPENVGHDMLQKTWVDVYLMMSQLWYDFVTNMKSWCLAICGHRVVIFMATWVMPWQLLHDESQLPNIREVSRTLKKVEFVSVFWTLKVSCFCWYFAWLDRLERIFPLGWHSSKPIGRWHGEVKNIEKPNALTLEIMLVEPWSSQHWFYEVIFFEVRRSYLFESRFDMNCPRPVHVQHEHETILEKKKRQHYEHYGS